MSSVVRRSCDKQKAKENQLRLHDIASKAATKYLDFETKKEHKYSKQHKRNFKSNSRDDNTR
jgi:hypothetical protein